VSSILLAQLQHSAVAHNRTKIASASAPVATTTGYLWHLSMREVEKLQSE
jgi:hypothetical protein